MNNLKLLRTVKSLAFPIKTKLPNLHTQQAYFSIVDKAMEKFLSPEEVDQVKHGFRRSEWSPEAFHYGLDKMNQPEHSVLKDKHYEAAIKKVQSFFSPKEKLRPVHFADLRKYPWPMSTNIGAPFATSPKWKKYVSDKYNAFQAGLPLPTPSGTPERDLFAEAHDAPLLPTMVDRRMTKRNLYNEMFRINRRYIHWIKNGRKTDNIGRDLKFWNTAFARQHMVKQDDPDKVRLVFGAPSLLLMSEQMFIWPIQAWLLKQGEDSPMLWGYETLKGGWYRLRNYFSRKYPRHNLSLALDWSGFDRDARHTVIQDIHSRILRPMFTFNDGYHPTFRYSTEQQTTEGLADPQRFENLWNWMTNAILHTPLLLDDGRMFEFRHSGIFSGFFQTQLLDTIYSMIMVYTILSRLGFDLDKVGGKFQGDDSLLALCGCYPLLKDTLLDMIAHYAKIYFGATLNVKKSEFRAGFDDSIVLSYRNKGGIPYRDHLELLAHLRYPETNYSFGGLMARSVGIAMAACGRSVPLYLICEDIFSFLQAGGHIPEQSGLTHMFKYAKAYAPTDLDIDLGKFPNYLDTINRLMENADPQPSKKYWNLDHFIGYPGF